MNDDEIVDIQKEAELTEHINQLEAFVKQNMTKEAIERYGNIKTADYDKSLHLITILAEMIQSGKVPTIDDNFLKKVLISITPQKREFNIKK